MFSSRTVLVLLAGLVFTCTASAQHIIPNPLLTIDQNRSTVVERIVGEWGDRLAASNAGVNASQLREILAGLRADHLLAASLAGSVPGLRDVVSRAMVHAGAAVSRGLIHTKSLGDTIDDLAYTPVTPCRIVDSRFGAGGTLAAGAQRDWLATNPSGDFTTQGGSATNCGITVKPAAVLVNITVANTAAGPAFLTAWPYNQTRPLAATLNWTAANSQVANAVIVPLCTGAGCTADFSFYAGGGTDVIVDVAGYFDRPTNYGGTHTITGQYATDNGGFDNTASGDSSTVAGGFVNTASQYGSSVAGGGSNIASEQFSTISGGFENRAMGTYSTVAGGADNIASGIASFAAGYKAIANVNGCFVFSDFSSSNVTSCGVTPNQFVARALGGVYFLTAGTSDATYSGAKLAPGATAWTVYSDRVGKDNLQRVDAKGVLRKVAAMPIATWNWKSQDAAIRHMGPMAQDFYEAFGLGETPKGISTVDADGVVLAAIQGLHAMMKQRDREIAQLKRNLRAVEAKLGKLSLLHLDARQSP